MPSPALLVSLGAVKQQCRVEHNEEDDYLLSLLADAEDIIVRFMGERFDAEWTTVTVPGAVRAAILRQCAYMWRERGDESKGDPSGVAPGVRWLLQANGYRDLTIG